MMRNTYRAMVSTALSAFVVFSYAGSAGAVTGTPMSTVSGKTPTSKSTISKVNQAALTEVAKDTGHKKTVFRVSHTRVSKVNKAFAATEIAFKDNRTDAAEVLLVKSGKTWKVKSYGTGGFTCDEAPLAVMNNLKVSVESCLPSQHYYKFTAKQRKVNARAMSDAKLYSSRDDYYMSKMRVIELLKADKYPDYAVQYVSSRVKADWNLNAYLTAFEYFAAGMSDEALCDQLFNDGFTNSEIRHALLRIYGS